MEAFGSVILYGDYGSPSGAAKLSVPNMIVEDYSNQQTKLQTFAAALKTAGLTGCGVGDVTSSQKSESSGVKPNDDINVQEKLVYAWRTKLDSSVRRGTIPGVPKDATIWDKTEAGDRLNATAKTALTTALSALYGITEPDGVIVLWGKPKED